MMIGAMKAVSNMDNREISLEEAKTTN